MTEQSPGYGLALVLRRSHFVAWRRTHLNTSFLNHLTSPALHAIPYKELSPYHAVGRHLRGAFAADPAS